MTRTQTKLALAVLIEGRDPESEQGTHCPATDLGRETGSKAGVGWPEARQKTAKGPATGGELLQTS